MEKTLIVANWKENLTAPQATRWFEVLSSKSKIQSSKLEIVICPPFVLIPVLKPQVSSLKFQVHLGAQDVSKFEEGQYTGEVSAKMLKDFVSYVIIGHSERRKYFGETNEEVVRKSILALKYDLIPIVCVSNIEEAGDLKLEDTLFVYEPVEHISTEGDFHPDDPEHANSMAKEIKSIVGQNVKVLYGGSVTSENVKSFVSQPDINGVLVGQASLDAEEFAKIVNNLTI